VGTLVPGRSSVPEARPRWRLVNGIALLLGLSCFASVLFIAMAAICAIPLYYSTFSGDWLGETVRRFTEVPGEITRWLGVVTVSAAPGGLGLLVTRRGRSAPRASISGSASRFAVWGLCIDGALTVLLVTLRPLYLLLRG
jgi:hypothetical protein